MQYFIKHFHRDPFGAWLCISPATVDLPDGRIQVTPGSRFTPGTMFMNVDLAALLDKEHFRQAHPGSSHGTYLAGIARWPKSKVSYS